MHIPRTVFQALALYACSFMISVELQGQDLQKIPATPPAAGIVWQEKHAEHVFGLPEAKPRKKGVLTLDEQNLTFTSKGSNTAIPRALISAVSAGNERVELWGTGGRLLRMAIPQGGGLAAAAVMHHRVDMLTVEFKDSHGAAHSAVFNLPAQEATHALNSFGSLPVPPSESGIHGSCDAALVEPRSVLVETPDWTGADVPAAYRSMVYEHIIDRLKTAKDVGSVYRVGEIGHGTACPRYRLKLAVSSYNKGNQILRAATGPIGMFTSATKMSFEVSYTDAISKATKTEQLKATVRTESESMGVADAVAKKVKKQYRALLKAASAQQLTAQP